MTHVAFSGRDNPSGSVREATASQFRSFAHPAVFLHCGWRTRGTWIWNQFRQLRGIAGYYEPLNELLATLRPSEVSSLTADSWPSGHKGLTRPYFDEYRPLLKDDRAGVAHYQARFATDDFFAAPDAAMPELEGYLRTLLNDARHRGEQPVLKFCGSLGRVGWMRRRFPDAAHIVVLRDPLSRSSPPPRRQFITSGNA